MQLAFLRAAAAPKRRGEPRAVRTDRGLITSAQPRKHPVGSAPRATPSNTQRPVRAGATNVAIRPAASLVLASAAPAAFHEVPAFVLLVAGVVAAHSSGRIRAGRGRSFATWDILPRLRTRAANKPITPSSRQFAGEQITQATAFLDWLAARQRTLRTCEQADIDTWHAEHAEHWRRRLRGFLIWAMASKLTRQLRLPAPLTTHGAPLPQPDRMALLGHLLTGHELPLRSRVAAVIVLLYAQRVSRIVRLTIDDVIYDGDQVMLRLGAPPSPVPTPFAQLLLAWINERDNMNTATNPHSRWLFPGRRAGQPMHPTTLAALIHKLGVPTRTARTTAIRQHLLEMPAAIVADALSHHPVTTAKITTQIGVTWSRYAPGDHPRTGDS